MHSGRFLAVFLAESWFSRMEPRSDLTLSSMVEFTISKSSYSVESFHGTIGATNAQLFVPDMNPT